MPHATRFLLRLLVAAIFATAWLAPMAAEPVAARDGSTMIDLVNGYRAKHGVHRVGMHALLDRIAVERANQMAAADDMEHDMDYVRSRLNAEGVCWERFGEIIAWNEISSPSDRLKNFVERWYRSDDHRAIMLNRAYTHAGGSWSSSSDGQHYAAMIFVDVCGASSTAPSDVVFTDIANSKFRSDILWIADEKITYGCTDTKYCPDGLVLRDQMATFLTRAMDLSRASRNYFNDTWGNKHRDSINRAAAAALTYGCDDDRYCPWGRVTRAQMASFLTRALDLPRATRDYFRDDEGNRHEDAINRLAHARITVGCASGRFCPDGYVTRGQMAAFLRRAFD